MPNDVKCILTEQGGKGGGSGSGISLIKITVTTPPTKTSYLAGDTFNTQGMVVTASYGLNANVILTEAEVSGYSISPSPLVDGTTAVTITYSEMGETCSTTQPVTVTHKLTSLQVTTPPTKTTYEYGDTLATAGAVVTATYSDGTSNAVTGIFSPTALNTVGNNQTITVSYAENGVTKTATFTVTVERKSIAKPTWKSNLTYNGSSQSVNTADKWNNFNTSYMSIGGTTSGTNAGTYTATFTLGSNYRWSDKTTDPLNIDWTINKDNGTLTLSSSTAAITSSNWSTGVNITITRSGTGTISYSPTSISGLTITLNGDTLNIKGNGSTKVNATNITISVSADVNYNAPTNKTLSVSATYWEWDSETATGDATWWAGLKSAVAGMNTSELSACVGKTKSVTLTSAVLGTTTHLVRCIGYNVHRDKNATSRNTLTFETANVLATATVFGTSNGKWTGSTVRQQCKNYLAAFPGKASVCTVSIGTATTTDSSQNGTPTYTDEDCFLLSDAEHGFLAGHDSNSGKGYSASYNEFDRQNTSKTPCQYCSSNANRIKKQGDSGSAYYYWERSLYYDNEYRACVVYNDGKSNGNRYDNSRGLAPAFVV